MSDHIEHVRWTRNRREFVRDAFAGFGSLAMADMLAQDLQAAPNNDPLSPKASHKPATAKSVIFLFMAGGPSHIDTFDPKPLLNRLHGQTRPKEFGEAKYQFVGEGAKLLGSNRTFKKYGQAGTDVSDLLPHTAQHVDDIAVLRSCHGDMVVHSAAQYQLFSGRIVPGFPSMGSWSIFGLGSQAKNVPSYVVMPDPDGALEAGQPMYMNGFLPAVYQPTTFRPGDRPVLNLDLPKNVDFNDRKKTVDLIKALNEATMDPDDYEFDARVRAYDLAFKMQTEAPEILDISNEPEETKELYGIGSDPTDEYGRRCLLARRLVEEGTRFVCVVSGGGPGELQWDAHKDIDENHIRMAAETDKPVAGLLADLKRRGLLDETLVVWGGEFGRSPEAQVAKDGIAGRDHHNLGFTMWMAGGGVKGGQTVGATDAIGLHAVEKPFHFRDIHTTMLHFLGLDQDRLSYLHLGRQERLTQLHGKVIEEIVA